MERIQKPWGYEIIWAKTDKYVGKVLHIYKGHCLSFQYHKVKEETIMVLSGNLTFLQDDVTTIMGPGEVVHIKPGSKHRMTAGTNEVEVLEVSTPELDDVVRISDTYGRS